MKRILSVISSLILIALCIVSCDNNTSTTSLKSIEITNKPTKTEYKINESLDTTSMVVTATYTNGKTKAVTGYSVDTTILTSVGTTTVTVTYSLNGKVRTATFDVNVTYPQFTVKFMKNDSTADNPSSATKKVDYEKPYGELPAVEKTNYTFLGWYDAPKGGNKIEATTKVTKTTDHSLYARWIENGKYIVTFACTDNDNPSTEKVPDDITGYVNQSILVPGNVGSIPLTKTGYTFDGWTTGTTDYDSGSFIKSDTETSITLMAKWKANEYNIIYKDKGDATFSGTHGIGYPQKHTYDSETTLGHPSKTDYAFDGWFTDSACSSGNKVSTIGATDYTSAITLYAKWHQIKGSAAVNGSSGRTACGWVQLWDNGPKFAEFNVGSTITSYAGANQTSDGPTAIGNQLYCTANVGGLYGWGGYATNSRETNTYPDCKNPHTEPLSGNDDTATYLWGSNWKMPTRANLCNLINMTDDYSALLKTAVTEWTWCDGVAHTTDGDGHMQYVTGCTLAGWKVSGKTGTDYENNSLFFPAAGCIRNNPGGIRYQGILCQYWSSTPRTQSDHNIYILSLDTSSKYVSDRNPYQTGYSVRAILAE